MFVYYFVISLCIMPALSMHDNIKQKDRKCFNQKLKSNETEAKQRITYPLKIPKLSRQEKLEKIITTGHKYHQRRLFRVQNMQGRRTLRFIKDPVWRRAIPIAPEPPMKPLLAMSISYCPGSFDAVTFAENNRIYLFSRDRVYQVWREDNLHQRASYRIDDLFHDGPRTVTVAYTNFRSGVTVLIEHKRVYRFRWNESKNRFMQTKKGPQILSDAVEIYPRTGFQWIDGNQVLIEHDKFVTYDAYWNFPTFAGSVESYFPNLPDDLVGTVYREGSTLLLYTSSNKIMIYDTVKYQIIHEIPLKISDFVGCMGDSWS